MLEGSEEGGSLRSVDWLNHRDTIQGMQERKQSCQITGGPDNAWFQATDAEVL